MTNVEQVSSFPSIKYLIREIYDIYITDKNHVPEAAEQNNSKAHDRLNVNDRKVGRKGATTDLGPRQ